MAVPSDSVGKDDLEDGIVGKGNELSDCVRLTVGTETLPVNGEVVLFQLGGTVILDVGLITSEVTEREPLGSDSVGNGTKVLVWEMLIVGIETFPPDGAAVLFQLCTTLSLRPVLVMDD
jgi:hypothetical protein